VGYFFDMKASTWCGKLDNPNCQGKLPRSRLAQGSCTDPREQDTITCGQKGRNAVVKAPAGWVIYNSMAGIQTLYQNVYDSIKSAQSSVALDVGTFVETFSPIIDDIKVSDFSLST